MTTDDNDNDYLKGLSNEIFDLQFFHHSNHRRRMELEDKDKAKVVVSVWRAAFVQSLAPRNVSPRRFGKIG